MLSARQCRLIENCIVDAIAMSDVKKEHQVSTTVLEMKNYQTYCWLDLNLLIDFINGKSVLGLSSDFIESQKLIL